jgi:hypothetical protein
VVNCIVLELTDGTLLAYGYPDEESAATWYQECRQEWNAGRNLIFYLPPRRHAQSNEMHTGDDVAHIELTTRESVEQRGIEYREAVIFA